MTTVDGKVIRAISVALAAAGLLCGLCRASVTNIEVCYYGTGISAMAGAGLDDLCGESVATVIGASLVWSGYGYETNYTANETNFCAVIFTNGADNVVEPVNGFVACEVLLVAGGGKGGAGSGYWGYEGQGGGGAGGFLYTNSYLVANAISGIAVGAGGSSVSPAGSNSVFGDLIALGGGYGGASDSPGGNGGSGGGGGNNSTKGYGTAGQGCDGKNGEIGAGWPYGGGMGGGAAQTGLAGGNGTNSALSGSDTWYCGGGGAGAGISGALGWPGGMGGGGSGENYSYRAQGGTRNTGGGGGGGGPRVGGGTATGGDGGSGIVIVRYVRQ